MLKSEFCPYQTKLNYNINTNLYFLWIHNYVHHFTCLEYYHGELSRISLIKQAKSFVENLIITLISPVKIYNSQNICKLKLTLDI